LKIHIILNKMIYKYLILIIYFAVCSATNYRLVSYVYTIHQPSFDIEGKSNCKLFKETSLETIKANSPGASCTAGGTHVHCIFNNPVECTDVAAACIGDLEGGKCGNQKVEVGECCYGLIDTYGTGEKAADGSCAFACAGLPELGTKYHGCKTCGCYHGMYVSGSDC
jgi:hypothetical protein